MIRSVDTFVPRASLKNGHRMTLYGWGNPRYFPRLPVPTRRYFDVARDTRVVADCHWQRQPWTVPTLITLHGLNGSSDAHYMRGLASKAFARGMNVLRLNQRNCGNTEHLAAGLFHSGLTADAAYVVDELRDVDGLEAIGLAGYSLGGNLALKLAGEYGPNAPAALVAVAAVSPIIEIEPCVLALERPSNALYDWNFVRDLKKRIRRKARSHPGQFDLGKLDSVRTVREFDEVFTAPYFGFRNAADYYRRASAMRVSDRIAVPALVISAEDDPFVPSELFLDRRLADNPYIDLRITAHGGHCGFIGERSGEDDGYWAEAQIVQFVERFALRTAAVRQEGSVSPTPEDGRPGASQTRGLSPALHV
jgi:predicted alpha/beta-fold hydrolase